MDFSKLIDWIKLSPKYLLSISLASFILLFANEKFSGIIGLVEFSDEFRPWIGAIFLLPTSLLLSHLIAYAAKSLYRKINRMINYRNHRKLLNNLSSQERGLLQGFYSALYLMIGVPSIFRSQMVLSADWKQKVLSTNHHTLVKAIIGLTTYSHGLGG